MSSSSDPTLKHLFLGRVPLNLVHNSLPLLNLWIGLRSLSQLAQAWENMIGRVYPSKFFSIRRKVKPKVVHQLQPVCHLSIVLCITTPQSFLVCIYKNKGEHRNQNHPFTAKLVVMKKIPRYLTNSGTIKSSNLLIVFHQKWMVFPLK